MFETVNKHKNLLWPLLAILCYPFFLNSFHGAVASRDFSIKQQLVASLSLAAVFFVPLFCFVLAWRLKTINRVRRFAFIGVATPTLYVFMGVQTYITKIPISDELIWCCFWLFVGIAALVMKASEDTQQGVSISRFRVVHGITAIFVVLFVLFHLFNHLMALSGAEAHDAVRLAGEAIYRKPLIEPLLGFLFLLMAFTGARLAWFWSAKPRDFYGTVQVATGIFLLFFVIGHMNSVFVFARSFLDTHTTWLWAVGAPNGLLLDAWNIRLLPHYTLAVLFVLLHINCGLRVILLKHHLGVPKANFICLTAALLSLAICFAITYAMLTMH